MEINLMIDESNDEHFVLYYFRTGSKVAPIKAKTVEFMKNITKVVHK